MKKILAVIFLFFVFSVPVLAGYVSENSVNYNYNMYQSLNQSGIGMYGKWYCADTVVMPYAGTISTAGAVDVNGYYQYSIEPFFFQEFDYTPNTKIDILEYVHSQSTYSVPTEGDAVFQVKYNDIYGNEPDSGYPVLILTHPNGSTETVPMAESSGGIFSTQPLNLLKGEYKYEYIATNEHYIYNDGFFSLTGDWYVTSRPYNFSYTYPRSDAENLPDDTDFRWRVYSDENSDILTYELYYWLDGDKNKTMKNVNGISNINNETSYKASGLDPMRQHHWYMRIVNKYGADLITDEYSFYTGGMVKKFYNAPNPFNPARGQKTKFVFNMPQSGTAKLVIYSEYGDKVWESQTYSFTGDNATSKDITYDGKDNSGRMLYNGSYLAVLTKKYGGKTKVEKCRILIVK